MLIDPTFLWAEVGRGGGKTEGILVPRMINASYSLKGSTMGLIAPTYVHLFGTVLPKIQKAFNTLQPNGMPLLTEGIHYVVGQKKLPTHFIKPQMPISEAKLTLTFAWGTQIRFGSADTPASLAGNDFTHLFFDEMRLSEGEKITSTIIPALRDNITLYEHSHYFQGITGVSDTPRIDLGDDNWFIDYEKNMNLETIDDILWLSQLIERKKFYIFRFGNRSDRQEKTKRAKSFVERNTKLLNEMRKGQTYYLRASSFVNKDVLGLEWFKNQVKSLPPEAVAAALANVRINRVAKMFFASFDINKHVFSDSYQYKYILNHEIGNNFKITSRDLKYCIPNKPLYMGWDPGSFMSGVIAQRSFDRKELRVLKNFYNWKTPQHYEQAYDIADFFGDHKEKRIILYYDRAGNQHKKTALGEARETDANLLKAELQKLKWKVELKNEKQRTIFYSEHYNLLNILFSEKDPRFDRIRICKYQCEELINSIFMSALIYVQGKMALDKSAEVSLPYSQQANFSTQISSALMYLLHGLYAQTMLDTNQRSTILV
jgi:hypothetical protein